MIGGWSGAGAVVQCAWALFLPYSLKFYSPRGPMALVHMGLALVLRICTCTRTCPLHAPSPPVWSRLEQARPLSTTLLDNRLGGHGSMIQLRPDCSAADQGDRLTITVTLDTYCCYCCCCDATPSLAYQLPSTEEEGWEER